MHEDTIIDGVVHAGDSHHYYLILPRTGYVHIFIVPGTR